MLFQGSERLLAILDGDDLEAQALERLPEELPREGFVVCQ